ncbi:hypothetical protein AVEN_3332-1 [Araneus ventricosus]|uniref:Uncharacterized protein n=1 Tax=Araneus ventricosus TaxID=182803 RepID=A0A4Y2R5B9_ARAVE|nr:hypothetical protein AVEN_3332-1 [Araneus ventricosus]
MKSDLNPNHSRIRKYATQPKSNPNIDDLFKKINSLNLDQDLIDFLVGNLQDLSKLFASKSRDIKAAVRDGIIENFVFPIINKIAERETSLMAMIYDLKSKHIDADLVIYQAKVRECENIIEGLKAKLQIVNADLTEAKNDLKETSSALVETAEEVRSISDKTEVLQSRPASIAFTPMVSKRDAHVVLLRPKKTSTSEENRKIIENALISRNSPARISKIAQVSQGGLIIEAPADADLQALEAVINLDEQFDVSRPKRRRPQIIILGIDNGIDKERPTKGLLAKNHFLADSRNNPLTELNFPIRARRNTYWVATVDPSVYKLIFDQPGFYFEFSRFRFDNFFWG